MKEITKAFVLFISGNLSLFFVFQVSGFLGVSLAGIYISMGIFCFLIDCFFYLTSETLIKYLRDVCDIDTIVKQAMSDMSDNFSEISARYIGRRRTVIIRCVFHFICFIPMILSFVVGIVIVGIQEFMPIFFCVLACFVAFYVLSGYYVVQKAIVVFFVTMMNKKIDEPSLGV